MHDQHDLDTIEAIYSEAMEKLEVLAQHKAGLVAERDAAIRAYIRQLEEQKIAAIRATIGVSKAE